MWSCSWWWGGHRNGGRGGGRGGGTRGRSSYSGSHRISHGYGGFGYGGRVFMNGGLGFIGKGIYYSMMAGYIPPAITREKKKKK
uniref:Uncharacterized protein n=1 Tax=Hyaloperonospora arabidopsidis (strain Emoy2) TaxID=559515 RepID=M4BCP2_HYAAE